MAVVTAAPRPAPAASPAAPPSRRVIVTIAAMLGMFLAAMDSTAVGTAMPTIVGAFGGLALYSWVFAAYQIAFVVATPIFGRLADTRGRKRVYLIGILGFVGASALCGLSRSMDELVFFRLLQGIGGGAVLPIAMTIIADLFPVQQRLRLQGMFSGVWGLAAVIGPLVGGFLADHGAWRWIFYLNIPAGLIATLILTFAFTESKTEGRATIDYGGIGLLSSATIALLLLMYQGGHAFPWLSLPAAGLAALTIVLALFFVHVETHTAEPFLPFSLLTNRVIGVCSIGGFVIGISIFGTTAYVPLFMQGVLGSTATAAGETLMPYMVMWTVASIAGGRLALRWGYRPLMMGGMALLAASLALLTTLTARTNPGIVFVDMFILGCGMGLAASLFMIAMQNAVTRQLRGVITAMNIFVRNLGSVIGVSAQGAVLVGILDARLAHLPERVRVALPTGADPRAMLDAASQARMGPQAHEAVRQALASGIHGGFLLAFVIVAAGLAAVVLYMPSGSVMEHSAHEDAPPTRMVTSAGIPVGSAAAAGPAAGGNDG